jgi:hypothetical protein
MPVDIQWSPKLPIMGARSSLSKARGDGRTETLTYPQEEKGTVWYQLFRAITRQAPDFLAKILAEVTYKVKQQNQLFSGLE